MRSDKLYLEDMRDFCSDAIVFMRAATKNEFQTNDLLRSAVQYKLLIIGEGAARISKVFRANHAQIEWKKIAAYRNFSIHAYFSVDWKRVWDEVSIDLPILQAALEATLSKEFPV